MIYLDLNLPSLYIIYIIYKHTYVHTHNHAYNDTLIDDELYINLYQCIEYSFND